MLWIKLTVLEARFLQDVLDDYDAFPSSEKDEAVELLERAIDNATEEEIPDE